MKHSLLTACLTTMLLAPFAGCARPGIQSGRVVQLQREIQKLELQCAPQKGTSLQEVEAVFGSGTPLSPSPSKTPPKEAPPADSPRRAYKLCEDGTLIVWYDSEGKVLHANYPNPYSTKGRPIGASEPTEEQLLGELEPRLKQMKIIADAYKKRMKG